MLVFYSITQAQVSSYNYSAAPGTFSLISGSGGGTTSIVWANPATTNGWTDNDAKTIALGFNFNFNGVIYTSVNVSPNGFLTFGSTTNPDAATIIPGKTNYSPISSLEKYEGAVSAYGYNLNNTPSTYPIVYKLQNAAPNRTFTVEYYYARTVTGQAITMQIRLNESAAGNPKAGVVEILYSSANSLLTSIITGQVGLRGENNTDFKNLRYATASPWPTTLPTAAFVASGFGNLPSTVNTNTVMTGSGATIASDLIMTWTPPTCFAPKKLLVTPVSSTAGAATVTLNWTPSTSLPSGGYDYYITTTTPSNSDNLPNAGVTVTGSVAAGVTTATVTTLVPGTQYYAYVRSKCGPDGGWSPATAFTTLCTPYTGLPGTPYTQNFNSASVPAFPVCNTMENLAAPTYTSGKWVTAVATAPNWGFATPHARTLVNPASGVNNNTSYFTQGIALQAGTSYRLSYLYGASSEASYTEQNMAVKFGTSPYNASMATTLATHTGIKGGPYTNVVNFTPTVTTTYYFGFYDTTVKGNATTLLDDIVLSISTCLQPTALLSGAITPYSAIISWTPPASPPGSGYEFYWNTTGAAPNGTTVPSGSASTGTIANLNGLPAGSTIYYWVRSNCGSGDRSGWAPGTPFVTPAAVTPATPYCTPVGSDPDGNGITNVKIGTIDNTTGLEAGGYGNYSNLITNVARGATVTVRIKYETEGYPYSTAAYIDWNNDGDFSDANEYNFLGVSSADNPSIFTSSFNVPAGAPLGQHRLRIGGEDDDFGTATNPCRIGLYQVFEDYSIYVISAPTPITLSDTDYNATICGGASTGTVTITSSGYTTYSWFPETGVSGNAITGYTFNPNSSITYILTGFNNTTFATTTVNYTVNVNQVPTPLSIAPVTATICQSPNQAAIALTSTGGIVSGFPIYKEKFNGSAPGWTVGYSGTNAVYGVWGLAPDGYNPFGLAYHSNDSSQFAFTESDSPGDYAIITTLTSPLIDLSDYETASLSFWQSYYRFNGPESGQVQISTTTAAGPYITLQTYGSSINVGMPGAFENSIIDLTPYAVANNSVYIRFTYSARNDWAWAIDNFEVTGGLPSVTWLPITGLYKDAAATDPYTTGFGTQIVYAKPTITTVYTASAENSLGCSVSSNTATVTVTPLAAGTATGGTTLGCGVNSATLSLTGYAPNVVGSIARWESADNSGFTGAATVPGSAGQPSIVVTGLSATTYYRAVIVGCDTVTSNTVIVSVPSVTWTVGTGWSNGTGPDINTKAVIDGDLTLLTPLSACSIYVKSGTLKVGVDNEADPDAIADIPVTLTVANEFKVNSPTASAIFYNTSSLIQGAATTVNANTGNIIYKRRTRMRKFDFTYWSTPVSNQALTNLSPFTISDKYFYFNTTTHAWDFVSSLSVMTPAIGYIIRAPQFFDITNYAYFTGSFEGVPNNGNYNVDIVYSALGNVNCIGNPYPSAVSALDFINGNAAAFGPTGTTLYFWTHNTPITNNDYSASDYASYNVTGPVTANAQDADSSPCANCNNSVPTGYIGAGQSFVIEAVFAGTVKTATFTNAMRYGGSNNGQFFRSGPENALENIERNRIWLELKNAEGAYKQMLVGYIQNATNGYDHGFDGKAIEAGNPVSLYSIAADTKLAIQGKALPFEVTDQVPVGFKTSVAGTYNISLSKFDGLFTDGNIIVYLEDRLLNVIHNLKDSPYSFVTEAGTFDDRFVLRYEDSFLAVTTPVFNENAVIAYSKNSNIHIKTSNVDMKSVEIYDIRGRLLLSQKGINNNAAVFNNVPFPHQVLIVYITSVDGSIVSKKIIF